MAERHAIHEAGHVVVADALGFWVESVQRAPEHDGPSGDGWATTHTGPDCPTAMESYLLCAVALAGGCAEILMWGDPGDCISDDIDNAHDFAMAAEADVDDAMQRAGWLATSILTARWADVLSVAARLEDRGGLDDLHIGELLDGYANGNGRRGAHGDVPCLIPDHGCEVER